MNFSCSFVSTSKERAPEHKRTPKNINYKGNFNAFFYKKKNIEGRNKINQLLKV